MHAEKGGEESRVGDDPRRARSCARATFQDFNLSMHALIYIYIYIYIYTITCIQ